MYYTPESQLIEAVSTLIRAGANVHVFNKHGEGCLHLLLRRISACNNYKMSIETASSIVNVLLVLLEQGCDPTLGNIVGYTPIDAGMSPAAWTLLYSAIVAAKKDIKNEMLAIDINSGIVQSDTEIEKNYAEVLGRISRTAPRQPAKEYRRLHTDAPCYLCARHGDSCERVVPFDEFKSPVVEELGLSIHMMFCKHKDSDECLRVQEEDSSHCLDYHPKTMSPDRKRERSWMRHVAYTMWRDDILRAPWDCQRWAIGAEEL